MSDCIVERIDALAAEEKCPHCEREWHERPLTQAVARMFDNDYLDSTYFTHTDRSPVVCDGSYLIGPRRPEPTTPWTSVYSGSSYSTFVNTLYDATWSYITLADPIFDTSAWTLSGIESLKSAAWGNSTYTISFTASLPKPEPECEPLPDVEVEFGPQNWLPPTEPIQTPPQLTAMVSKRLDKFAAAETHTPKSPGFDFTKFDIESPSYPTEMNFKKGKK